MKPKRPLPWLASLTPIAATLTLVVSTHAATDTWSGATNGTWDTTTSNWLDDSTDTLFNSGNDALFTGTPTNNVTTAAGLTIGAITLDNTFTGSVTMSGPNTVSGATTISGGTLNLNHQTGLGSSAVTVNSGGTVNVTLGSDQNVNNVFTGAGILTVSGNTGTPNFNNASALNGFTGTLNVNTTGGKKVALTTAGGKIGSGATVDITSGGTLYIANTTASFDGVTFNVVGSGNTENLGAIRIEANSVIGATSSVVLGGDTSLGSNNGTGTINAAITQSTISGVTKVGAQTLALGGTNTYTGTTTISAGNLQLGIGGTTGSLSTSSAITNNATLTINRSNAVVQGTDFNSVISGTGTFVQAGTGTTTLSGANTYSGGTRANAGTLVLSGTRANQAGSADWLSVNNVGAQNATLKIVSGADWGIQDFNIGEAANSRAAVFQTGGTLAVSNGVWLGNNNTNAYGYYNISNGTLTNAGGDLAVGRGNGSTGVMDVSGGTVTTSSWIVLGRGQGAGTAASGLLNVTGGSVTSNSNNIGLNWAPGSGALSVLNVGGGSGAASVTGASNAANYLDVSQVSAAGTTSVVNALSNGTLTVAQVRVTGANSTALFNFNGGTLKASAANAGANFMNSGNMDAVTVYSGGGTIHNNGTNISIGNALRAATGNGVTSIAVTNGGSGYIGAPMVKITGGTGNTATGYAVMADDGTGNGTFKVSSIVITSGGTYSVDPTTVTLTGGGASTAATIGAITTAANTSGGMNFTGSGTTTLTNTNTYTGTTSVTAGTLALGANGSIANSSEIALNGGNFNVSAVAGFSTGASQTLTGNGGSVTGDITVNGTLAIGSSPGSMTFNDDLTIGGSAVSNFELTDIAFGLGTYDLAQGGAGTQAVTFGGTLNLLFSGGTYANNTSVQIFDFETYGGGFTTVNFSGLGAGQSAVFNASTGFVTVIPEPGPAALFGGLGVLALLRRRRH